MWKCLKCGRNFRNNDQQHYCGKVETIDQYIGEQDEKTRPILEKVRQIIRAAAPESKEKISWQMPTFWQGENLVHFAAHKKHLGFYPGDLSLAPFRDKLEGVNTTKGTIQFPYDKIDYDLIAHITKWRLSVALERNKK